MKAIRFAAAGVAGMAEMELPEIKPGHALVRVRAAGLCHTDIEVLHGRYGEGAFPLVPGHEYAGTVEAVADDVTAVRPGDRVAVDPNIPCGQCPACRKGLTNLCVGLKAYGVTENGGFAEFSLVAVDHLHGIGDLAFATAALAEPLACVLNGLGAAGLDAGRPGNALVFGAGPIGLLLALSLKAKGVRAWRSPTSASRGLPSPRRSGCSLSCPDRRSSPQRRAASISSPTPPVSPRWSKA